MKEIMKLKRKMGEKVEDDKKYDTEEEESEDDL